MPKAVTEQEVVAKRRGQKPKPIVEFPEPSPEAFIDPPKFAEALTLQVRRHGDTYWTLHRAIIRDGETFDRKTIQNWAAGTKSPATVTSLRMLERIEHRYRLPAGYFSSKLPRSGRAVRHDLPGLTGAERRRIAWRLPDDFDTRPIAERETILDWVRTTIVAGSTEYRRYQAQALRARFSLRFPALGPASRVRSGRPGDLDAPAQLSADVAALVRFKTATLTAIGERRTGVWGEETAEQKIEHLGLLFGALAAEPDGPVAGAGVPRENLTLAMLIVPAVWDWYLAWREAKRGFFTSWEADMLELAKALTRRETGWLRQNRGIGSHLQAIAGLLDEADVSRIQSDWNQACDDLHSHACARAVEVRRVSRVHRDPFEPILPILETDCPLAEYRRIATEVISRMPDRDRYPLAAAESIRGFLMLRLGLHLGVRQKNLRQLLFRPKGMAPTAERQLERMRRGELRWSERDQGWEVLIPAVAFKNASSSLFGSKPFRLVLPDLDGLYPILDEYLRRHRPILLGDSDDPDTFFVKTVKGSSRDAAYDRNTFYEAWRLIIQRYGIYNPYTERAAVPGLLPHGPHNVRDVLATHILKLTGSYEQASYAIQDTPEMVRQRYGRFLPQDKAALAAEVLNRVWAALRGRLEAPANAIGVAQAFVN